ncbi:MAG TPA: helix-turn-helix transcriptional regulator [Chthoniobacterales bacterium]|nr:helix-turn-helix transcriptional regulator [Chthoniobacterales bacterium]
MRVRRITSALDAELQALLDLHAAKTLKQFWRSAQRVLHSALPGVTLWFAPVQDWLPPSAAFRAETALQADSQFQRFLARHPLKAFLLANPQRHLATFSDVMTDAQLRRSRFYREFMTPQHERFSVVLALWHQTSLRALIGLNRLQDDNDFSRAELGTIGSLHGHLSAALNGVLELQRERSARGALELVLAPLPLPIVVLDWELNVLYHNHAANESAMLWLRRPADAHCLKQASRFEVPAHVGALCRELKAVWIQSGDRARHSSGSTGVAMDHPTLPGFQASVRLVHPDSSGLRMPFFVVVFEHTHGLPNATLADAGKFSQLARLSVREREVASLVCKGESNKEVAARLGKSVLTVKTQLQSIYGKLGRVGRGRLISLLQER